MIVPTATNFKFKFPEFQNVPDATVEFMIEEARRRVDDSWIEGDQTLGIYYLAAHYLMVSLMHAQSATGQVVTSERIGVMSLTYANVPARLSGETGDYSTTYYGQRYDDMLRLSQPMIAVI